MESMDFDTSESVIDSEICAADGFTLVIDDLTLLLDEDFVSSIMNIKQKIKKIRITVNVSSTTQCDNLKTIFQKFGLETKILLWEKCIFSLSQCSSFLNLLPNLSELFIRKWHLKDYAEDSNLTPFNFSKLRSLIVIDCDFGLELLLHKIPQDVLQEVVFEKNRFRDLSDFFSRQQNITKLKMHNPFTLDHQKLTHLSFEPWNGDDVSDIIRSQEDLVFLEVKSSYRLMNNEVRTTAIFNEVCELQSLQVLKIDIDFVTNIESIHKLYNLKELQLSGKGDGIEFVKRKEVELHKKLKMFAAGRFPWLTKLSLHFPNAKIPDRIIKAIGKQIPTIESFKITAKFFTIDTILYSFVELTSVTASYKSDDDQQPGNYYNRPAFITLRYPNLKHLSLNISNSRATSFSFPEKILVLLNDLTELESLKLAVNFQIKKKWLESIFESLQKLSSLSLTQDCSDIKGRINFGLTYMQIVLRREKLEKFVIEDKARDIECDERELKNFFSQRFQQIIYKSKKIVLEKAAAKETSFTENHFE